MKPRWMLIFVLSLVAVFVIGVAVSIFSPRDTGWGSGLPKLRPQIPRSAIAVYESAVASYHEYRVDSARWAVAYFASLFGAAIFSAFAGLILKLETLDEYDKPRKDIAAFFSIFATLLITLSTAGDFESRWRANRVAANGMQSVIYELSTPGADIAKIIEHMNAIEHTQNEAVISKPGGTATQ